MSDGFSEFGRLQRREGVSGDGVCLADSGILVTFLASRFAAGESITELARDYGREEKDIEAAIRLVVLCSSGRHGVRVETERRMEDRIPLLKGRTR